MTVIKNSLLSLNQRVAIANDMVNNWTTGNVYIGVGQENPYSSGDNLVPVPNQSQDYINSVYRTMIAIKHVTAADIAFIVPRVDWQANSTYDAWDNAEDMYTSISHTQLTGTINVSNSRTVTGQNTLFTNQVLVGDQLFVPGDGLTTAPQTLQVSDVFSNTSLNVNTAFSGNFVSNSVYLVSDATPGYAKNFYVRNLFDQVFICLFNNSAALSTVMPQITIGGQLPQDPYIATSDGYKWKYLYTIPSGQKQKFLSADWMPVFSDATVVAATVNGRLDVVEINNQGQGYNQNVASNSATILTVVGDGTGANLTAKVDSSGKIFDVNILNGGSNYTYANITVSAGTTGANANLRAIIGPQGGHGYHPIHELGATNLIISVRFSGTEGGTLPVGVSVGTGLFDYRQVALIQDPLLTTGLSASNTNYSTVTTVSVQPLPSGQFFSVDEVVYQGSSLEAATFVGTVVYWDNVNAVLWLNNTSGSFTPQAPIVGILQTSPVTAFILTPSVVRPYSGRLLYVNNILPVIRGINQTEQLRIILKF